MTLHQILYATLSFDTTLQILTVIAGALGCAGSLYAIVDATRTSHALTHANLNGLRLGIVRLHLVTHAGILVAQVLLTVTSVLTMTLPTLPLVMYTNQSAGLWVVGVILARKLLRLAATVVLLWVAAYKVRWLHQLGSAR